jgi:hypothetical protein
LRGSGFTDTTLPMAGRKPKPKSKLKDEKLIVRITSDDKERYQRAADAAKADDVSEWVRKLLNAECERLGVS